MLWLLVQVQPTLNFIFKLWQFQAPFDRFLVPILGSNPMNSFSITPPSCLYLSRIEKLKKRHKEKYQFFFSIILCLWKSLLFWCAWERHLYLCNINTNLCYIDTDDFSNETIINLTRFNFSLIWNKKSPHNSSNFILAFHFCYSTFISN